MFPFMQLWKNVAFLEARRPKKYNNCLVELSFTVAFTSYILLLSWLYEVNSARKLRRKKADPFFSYQI